MGIPAAATACRNPNAPSEPNAENRRDEPHEHLERTLEKIRQADAEGAVSIGTFEGNPALILSSEVNGIVYHTYIYEYHGMLKELMERSDISLSASAGQDILAMERFEITAVNDHLVQCTMKNPEENTISFYICIRSGGFEDADEKFF